MSDVKLESSATVDIGVGKSLFMLSGRRCSDRSAVAANPNQGKHFSRRRHTSFSAAEGFKRRKKDGGIVPPTKFLLGGNINDPLNLNSLSDEVNQVTPKTSPMPTPKHRIQVQVLIPPNINDPLNLNADDDAELQLMSPKTPKRKHRKKKKRSSGHTAESRTSSGTASVEEKLVPSVTQPVDTVTALLPPKTKDAPCTPPRTLKLDPLPPSLDVGPFGDDPVNKSQGGNRGGRRSDDKIVSPVIPQPGMVRKRVSSSLSVSESSDKGHKKGKGHTVAATSGQGLTCTAKPRIRENDAKYRFGNYDRYYGYRNPSTDRDVRLQCFRREWFEGMDVLDIGCNVGHLTLTLASEMQPRKIIGIDIDAKLIRVANRNVRHYLQEKDTMQASQNEFPISFALCHGPIVAPVASIMNASRDGVFPNNVFFVEGNYILECDELLEMQKPAYDTIMCLSLTKWVHLNWGDEGLKRLFKRIYRQLRPGGRMILEAQAFSSYTRKKKLTEKIFENYNTMRLMPDRFTDYLLSQEVGFTKCEVVDVPMNPNHGFRRPIQLFTKGSTSSQSPFQDSDFLAKLPGRNTKMKEPERKESFHTESGEDNNAKKSYDPEECLEESSKLKGRCKKVARKRKAPEIAEALNEDSKLKEKRRKDVESPDDERKLKEGLNSQKPPQEELKPEERCRKSSEHKRKKKSESEDLKDDVTDSKRRKFTEHKESQEKSCNREEKRLKKEGKYREDKLRKQSEH